MDMDNETLNGKMHELLALWREAGLRMKRRYDGPGLPGEYHVCGREFRARFMWIAPDETKNRIMICIQITQRVEILYCFEKIEEDDRWGWWWTHPLKHETDEMRAFCVKYSHHLMGAGGMKKDFYTWKEFCSREIRAIGKMAKAEIVGR